MAEGYTVTDVMERKRFTGGGREITYYDISIVTDKGGTGTLRVRDAEYEKKAVAVKLEELRAKIDQAFEL